ncbi:tetratricopeptide repeat protein 12 isoform X2 [Corvus cornix cornix]|uniref:tetratricopeptide repeat protein 12 isoform X2 n=1 Tax=Corvus cornix cornix TaxID=932674 RepID=UPI001951455C|nr:tetratricopeptide repeat protein 12 isoform X2 [Corvus cornix cornix]
MLRDEDTEADFQRFLRRVDAVANLLQGLNSSDSAVKEEAIAETEKRLREEGASREEEEEESRTTVNRTVINTSVRAFPSEIKAGHSSGLASLKAQMEAFQECQNVSNPCHPLFKCQMDDPSVCQSGYFRCTQIFLGAPCSFVQGFLCCCGFSQNICAVSFFQDMARAEAVDAGAFLAALEKDAKERAQRRKKNEQLANALKEKGNEAFREGDFALAIRRYTEGLQKLKDKQELYTNRAQAYLKLHEYEKAISDCEWALKCNKNCLKAYFLMGKAHLALQHFSESRHCYEKMLQIDPQKENLFKDCVNEANLEEKRVRDEERAAREVQAGNAAALSIQELLQRINTPGQDILYYTAGIRLLAEALNNCTGQTLFRTNNGFSILGNEPVRGAFCAERKSPAEVELCVSLLLLWQAACAGNEENQRLLLAQPEVNAQLPELLSSGTHEIQRETLALICLCSENESSRRLLARQELSRWLQVLMAFVRNTDEEADGAMSILSDLIVADRFQTEHQVLLSRALLTELMGRFRQVNPAGTALTVGMVGSLCADAEVRAQLARSRECWQACLDECSDGSSPENSQCVLAVLGLMMNLLLESNDTIQWYKSFVWNHSPIVPCSEMLGTFQNYPKLSIPSRRKNSLSSLGRCRAGNSLVSPDLQGTLLSMIPFLLQPSQPQLDLSSPCVFQDFAVPISGRCLALLSHQDGRIVTRATGVLSRALPASPSAVEEVVKGGVVKKMLKFLKVAGQLTSSYAIKTLSICTKSSRQAQEELVKWDKRFQVLLKLLESENELIVGNAAFCLSQCLLIPGAATSLLDSNVVLLLLRQAGGDAQRTSVQENSAIALGRLCKAEPRHIPQLRKLNGFSILNSSMKPGKGITGRCEDHMSRRLWGRGTRERRHRSGSSCAGL